MKYHSLEIHDEQIVVFYRKHYIRKLSLFGSILRDDFGPDSDVDVLVEFDPEDVPGLAFFGMKEELDEVLGRSVDLLTYASLRNPFLRHQILKNQQVIYVA